MSVQWAVSPLYTVPLQYGLYRRYSGNMALWPLWPLWALWPCWEGLLASMGLYGPLQARVQLWASTGPCTAMGLQARVQLWASRPVYRLMLARPVYRLMPAGPVYRLMPARALAIDLMPARALAIDLMPARAKN